MTAAQPQFDFASNRQPTDPFQLFEDIIEDKGSRYSVSVGFVQGREDIQIFLTTLKKQKRYAKATHNSWAARIANDGAIYESKQDDGEVGAGLVILRMLQKCSAVNIVICVTRWFGGTKLHSDRFRHLQRATHYAVTHMK